MNNQHRRLGMWKQGGLHEGVSWSRRGRRFVASSKFIAYRFSHDHRDTRDSYLSPSYYYRATSSPVSSTFCRKVWTAYLSWKLLEENVALQLKPCILFFVLYFSLLAWGWYSILQDRKIFNHLNPEEFQPERYLKDGKLNPEVRDPDCAAFWFGRRSVNVTIHTPQA